MAFFHSGEGLRVDVLKYVLGRLKVLHDWLATQKAYRFFSSSLLFVYEGDSQEDFKADVRMIDFAHVFEIKACIGLRPRSQRQDGGFDDGYVKGLKRLLVFLERFLTHKKGESALLRPSVRLSSPAAHACRLRRAAARRLRATTMRAPSWRRSRQISASPSTRT